jgi:predicted  nucleic acid-binding Zn-ribbon protein
MSANINMSFSDVIVELHRIWDNSEKHNTLLQVEVQHNRDTIKQLTIDHTELLKSFKSVNEQNINLINEITQLKQQVQDAEDYQKQFRKVSHILTMDRENNNFKQQIAILEKRVAFYQNQCTILKGKCTETQDKQTETETILVDMETNTYEGTEGAEEAKDILNDSNIPEEEPNEDGDIDVTEKKIKGVIYYVSNDDDIYVKNEDESIGELKGKIEHLPSGKTKVKWYKLK